MIDYVMLGLAGIGILYILGGIRIVGPQLRGIVITMGMPTGYKNSGVTWVAPIFQKITKVYVSERIVYVKPQLIQTKDGLNVEIDVQPFYKVKDDEASVMASQFKVNDYRDRIRELTLASMRDTLGSMPFDEIVSGKGEKSGIQLVNERLRKTLQEGVKEWGVEITKTVINYINPPHDVQKAMNEIVVQQKLNEAAKHEANKRETIADGTRRATIKEAEGSSQGIKLVNDMVERTFKGKAQAYKKLETVQRSLENNSKVVITERGISPNVILDDRREKKRIPA